MSKVEVLCPTGHRIAVNVLPTTKIIKVLEEVCLRKGFLPIYDYEIRHGRKSLELSASIQEAGLTNLAKLELVKRPKPWVESKVQVLLQTSEGQRMQREFMPSTSLLELLESFEEDNGSGHPAKLLYHRDKTIYPVIIYVKEEIVGKYALSETTLRSLGVLSGRVLLRHLYREVAGETLTEIKDAINKEKLRFAKILEKSAELIDNVKDHLPTSPDAAVESPRDEAKSLSCVALETKTKTEDEGSTNKPILYETRDEFSNQQNVQPAPVGRNRNLVNEADEESVTNYPMHPFANFKFPEETKGKDLHHNVFRDVTAAEFQSCDRELVAYRLDEPMTVDDSTEEIPDQFFEVTTDDLVILQRDLEKNIQQLSEQPLMTQAMRQADMEERLCKYKRVVIRILFPDRHVIQGIFQPKETVYAVYKFVRERLVDKSINFELYTSPPKQVLEDMTETLVEARLVPMTRIYYSSPFYTTDSILKPEIIDKVSSRLIAEEIVLKYASAPQHSENVGSSNKRKIKDERSPAPQTSSNNRMNQTRSSVPKWLQLGKK